MRPGWAPVLSPAPSSHAVCPPQRQKACTRAKGSCPWHWPESCGLGRAWPSPGSQHKTAKASGKGAAPGTMQLVCYRARDELGPHRLRQSRPQG